MVIPSGFFPAKTNIFGDFILFFLLFLILWQSQLPIVTLTHQTDNQEEWVEGKFYKS